MARGVAAPVVQVDWRTGNTESGVWVGAKGVAVTVVEIDGNIVCGFKLANWIAAAVGGGVAAAAVTRGVSPLLHGGVAAAPCTIGVDG